MKKLPTSLKLTWHKGFKKTYPKYGSVYCVMIGEKGKKEKISDFAYFLPETIKNLNEKGEIVEHNFDRFCLLANDVTIGEIYIHHRLRKHQKLNIEDWAEIKARYDELL